MPLTPWYKVATPRKEVREGRSFNPDEFAIHLEQVVAGTAPEDYRDPVQFFARTRFTRALREHVGMVLRRLAGETANTAPVMTLITQFGGGKTHTLNTLYHLAGGSVKVGACDGVQDLIEQAQLKEAPKAKIAVFVGNAWDPQEGRETPWIDIARQLAGDAGVRALGTNAKQTPPGTKALGKIFSAADAPVLILFDEVLNFMNRHRDMAEQFHAFIQNLTVAITATTHGAAVISLPRSQVEMTEKDLHWQDKITKMVRRVAKDLIANDEAEIGEVVRRRLFDDIGDERTRKKVAKAYADWCFERRAELPPEWMAVNSASTEAKAREFLRGRFEACYPFHPSTLSVFQRKWQALPQYQQTRGTLAMLAQWISWAQKDGFGKARREPLITLGSAPLDMPDFCAVVLGQLDEQRLQVAIDSDIAGDYSHARALDADTKGLLRDIHRRVGTAVFFESSGGQVDKVAHLPELRFALSEPDIDTTSVDNAARLFEEKSYFTRKVGSDGFKIGYHPTLKKVVSDRRASLDEETEIKPAMQILTQKEFGKGANVPFMVFPTDSTAVQETPRLSLVVISPESEWEGNGPLREQIADWTVQRGNSPRLYPGSLVWCVKKQGPELRVKVAQWLAWKRVVQEVVEGALGADFTSVDHREIEVRVKEAEDIAMEEVWASYRYAIIADCKAQGGLKIIDLGAGHSSSGETLTGRVIAALKSEGLLNESVGPGYIGRHWPDAFKESGAWPLTGLRKSFLDGSLTRLADPDAVLKAKIAEFVSKGDFGLASGPKSDGTYEAVWFEQPFVNDEIVFEPGVFLISKDKAKELNTTLTTKSDSEPSLDPTPIPEPSLCSDTDTTPKLEPKKQVLRLEGTVPPEMWNRIGTKLLPKLRSGEELTANISLKVSVDGSVAKSLRTDLQQILKELDIADQLKIRDE